MIRDFQEYSATIASTESLDTLAAFTVGIEATEYLNMLPKFPVADVSRPIKEALLPALGGLPLGLRFVIQKTISVWRQHKVTPVFVFSGLDFTKRDATFAASEASAAINAEAWALYDSHEPVKAVEMFGQSTSVTAEDMFRYLQSILREEGVEFVVAPYGASAQLSYLYSCGTIDTIYGSSEVLFYDVPDLITGWDFQTSEFTFVKRRGQRSGSTLSLPRTGGYSRCEMIHPGIFTSSLASACLTRYTTTCLGASLGPGS
ncbi:PIN domain-like protein [Trichodelitschia bisporula]|uniref:PIN domain-like protein n=1 Tax=Trichodelitschia bisporula TaxID=703511 RepID=A0A6G1HL82_9PEZI|nr:PIN domain-like protein [Trichodelitschia bisporula]